LQEYEEKLKLVENKNKQRIEKVRREFDTIVQSTRSSVSGPSWNRIAEPSPRTSETVDASSGKAFKGKGWRQSPILKPVASVDGASKSARRSRKGVKGKKRRSAYQEVTGWATEDATDIQEMGDFDFEGSLAKFDKRSVFEQLRQEDSIPTEERLVGHNRLKNIAATRPGTFGGTKLHPTENVLDGPNPRVLPIQKPISRRSSALKDSVSSESLPESEDVQALRSGSRLSSIAQPKRQPIRSNTSTSNIQKLERSSTGGSKRLDASIHSARHITSSTSNENFTRLTPAASPALPSSAQFPAVNFYIGDTESKCPTISPGAITALEALANSHQNISHDTLNENAGRSLAEIIINELSSQDALPRLPLTALFLVGNHRGGARALAAARHLRDRGISSVCCVLGLDRPGQTLDAEVKTQLSMIRTPETAVVNVTETGRTIVIANWREVTKFLMHNEGHQDIWVDALLAPGHTYDTLVPDEQICVREMAEWVNHVSANDDKLVVSVDVPCGINASTGWFNSLTSLTKLTNNRREDHHRRRDIYSYQLQCCCMYGSTSNRITYCCSSCLGPER
jgi:enhancer of mRNA-decapping protein 3